MKNKKAEEPAMREVFKTKISKFVTSGCCWAVHDVFNMLKNPQWTDGDKVRVTIERLR